MGKPGKYEGISFINFRVAFKHFLVRDRCLMKLSKVKVEAKWDHYHFAYASFGLFFNNMIAFR